MEARGWILLYISTPLALLLLDHRLSQRIPSWKKYRKQILLLIFGAIFVVNHYYLPPLVRTEQLYLYCVVALVIVRLAWPDHLLLSVAFLLGLSRLAAEFESSMLRLIEEHKFANTEHRILELFVENLHLTLVLIATGLLFWRVLFPKASHTQTT